MADEWGVNYRPRPKYQFVWWPRFELWFARDAAPLGLIYSWRLSLGPLEVRRWNYSINKAPHGNAQASAPGSREHTASRLINGRGAVSSEGGKN